MNVDIISISSLIYCQLKICRMPAKGKGKMNWEMKSSNSRNRGNTEINTVKKFEWVNTYWVEDCKANCLTFGVSVFSSVK